MLIALISLQKGPPYMIYSRLFTHIWVASRNEAQ